MPTIQGRDENPCAAAGFERGGRPSDLEKTARRAHSRIAGAQHRQTFFARPAFIIADLKEVLLEFIQLISDYIKDYVALNQFVA